MTHKVVEAAPDVGFERVEPVRLRPEITLRAYNVGMRVKSSGSVALMCIGEVMPASDSKPCSCSPCKKLAADEAMWSAPRADGYGGPHAEVFVARRVVHMDNQFVQNIAEELAGRLPETVDAEKARKGDKVQDEGWIKTIRMVTIVGDRVVFHFERNPYSPKVNYQLGHPALVYRVIDDDEH